MPYRLALPLRRLFCPGLALATSAVLMLGLSGCYTTEPLCTSSNAVIMEGLEGNFGIAFGPEPGQTRSPQAISETTILRSGNRYVAQSTTRFEGRTETSQQELAVCSIAGQTVLQIASQPYQFVLLSPNATGFALEQRGFSRDLLRRNGISFTEFDVTMENKQPLPQNAGVAPELVLSSLDRSPTAWANTFWLIRR